MSPPKLWAAVTTSLTTNAYESFHLDLINHFIKTHLRCL